MLALQANFLLNFLLTSLIGKLYAVKLERIVVCFFFPLFSVVISKGATITTFFSIKFDNFFWNYSIFKVIRFQELDHFLIIFISFYYEHLRLPLHKVMGAFLSNILNIFQTMQKTHSILEEKYNLYYFYLRGQYSI
jgi:hypothetical protein